MIFCLFIYLLMDTSYFYFLAIVINAAMNIAIQVSVRVLALSFLGYIRVELLVPRVIVCLAFLGTTKLFHDGCMILYSLSKV